jgi:hypothetical protein
MRHQRWVAGAAFQVFFLLFLVSAQPAYSYTDQLTVERMLNENKSYITFMDVCLTNFGEPKAQQYRQIYETHFNAEVAFLQSDYKLSFKKIYASQGQMSELIADMVGNSYLEHSKDILDQLAPEVIRTKNQRAKLYLTLGYRDRAVSHNYYTIGRASNPKLYSYKIFRYIEAIKMARRAKRYGFFALYESQTDEMKLRTYNHLFEMEREGGSRFYNRFLNKSGDSFLKELNRDIDEVERSETAEIKTGTGTGEKGNDDEAGTFEKKVERRVRLRNEKTVAQHLLNAEYEKAEDIIRTYVPDFNFKLIRAVFEVLAASGGEKAGGIDYRAFLLHHTDNYVRYSKGSLLDSFSGQVKVEDYVEKSPADKEYDREREVDAKDKAPDLKKTPQGAEGKKEAGGK